MFCCTVCVPQTMMSKASTSERSSEYPICTLYPQEITPKLSRCGRPKPSVLSLCSLKCRVLSSGPTMSPLHNVIFPVLFIGLLLVISCRSDWCCVSMPVLTALICEGSKRTKIPFTKKSRAY
jgi:hypothetical protein